MSSLSKTYSPQYLPCHGKNGPPPNWFPQNKFVDKYGPPGIYFTAKVVPPPSPPPPKLVLPGTNLSMNMEPLELIYGKS